MCKGLPWTRQYKALLFIQQNCSSAIVYAKMTFLLTVVDSRLQMFGESFILPSKKAPNKVVVRISAPLVTSG